MNASDIARELAALRWAKPDARSAEKRPGRKRIVLPCPRCNAPLSARERRAHKCPAAA